MDKLIIKGGIPLKGEIQVSGAKNVAMKAIVAGLLTDETVVVQNIPLISSVLGTVKVVSQLGVLVNHNNHQIQISAKNISRYKVPLESGGLYRTATMVIGPLLARFGRAIVPNPGGCRLGKRPVDWHIEALREMGAKITYREGYFYAETKKITGARIKFEKNTHTGTESVILTAVLASGKTVIENAAQEPEVDDLIVLLNNMGAKIVRNNRTIMIQGVKKLHGVSYSIMPDRNEVVTFAIAAIATRGDLLVKGAQKENLQAFIHALDVVGGGWEEKDRNTMRFYWKQPIGTSDIVTKPYPGFMTDWQQPWAVLSTQATGVSTIHETVFESRFSYVLELKKMGAKIDFFDPSVENPNKFYNFNWSDRIPNYHQGIKIYGPTKLHEAVLEMTDIRAGATLVVAALAAYGKTVVTEVEHLDRGYENLDERLKKLGAQIRRVKEEL